MSYHFSPLLVESWTKCRRIFLEVGILSGYQHVAAVFQKSNFSEISLFGSGYAGLG